MYVSPTPEQRAAHDIARSCSTRLLQQVQPDFRRYQNLEARGDAEPLIALERLELAAKCGVLATALERAADEWDLAGPALAAAYRQLARGYRDADALHEALADIAPAEPGDDPFEG